MFNRSQTIILILVGLLLVIIGVALASTTSNPRHLHFDGLSFVLVGAAVLVVLLTIWLNDRYQRCVLLGSGLLLAAILFAIAFVFFLASYM